MATESGGQRRVRPRGLPSLNEARAERHRALVYGKYRLRGQVARRFWLWTVVILSAFGVIYWKIWQGELISQKSAVMAKQRAVAETLTPRVVPFRDQIEAWVRELAGDRKPNNVAETATLKLLNSQPGVYLRLRLPNAQSAESIREAASESLLDGFISCLFVRRGEPDPTKGIQCHTSADCEPGLLCNEYQVCLPPPKPYNMRLAYQALSTELEIGLLLPCNVIVYEEDGGSMVSIVDPISMLGVVESAELEPVADDARARLERVIEAVSG